MRPRGLNLGVARPRRKGQAHGQMHGYRLSLSLEAKAEGRGSKRKARNDKERFLGYSPSLEENY